MITKAISDYMKANGIKQSFICKETGLTRSSISCSFNGKRKLGAEEYGLICEALNLPYDFFFDKSRKTS